MMNRSVIAVVVALMMVAGSAFACGSNNEPKCELYAPADTSGGIYTRLDNAGTAQVYGDGVAKNGSVSGSGALSGSFSSAGESGKVAYDTNCKDLYVVDSTKTGYSIAGGGSLQGSFGHAGAESVFGAGAWNQGLVIGNMSW